MCVFLSYLFFVMVVVIKEEKLTLNDNFLGIRKMMMMTIRAKERLRAKLFLGLL